MKDNFQPSLKIILKEEGGNDDDPRDPGGRTSRGIIQREWNVFRQKSSKRDEKIASQAERIGKIETSIQFVVPALQRIEAKIDAKQ